MQLSFSKTLVATLVCGLCSISLFANEAEISLNGDTAKLAGLFEMGGFDIEAAALHNQDRGNVFSIAGLSSGYAGEEGLDAGVGLKLAYVDPDLAHEVVCLAEFCPDINADGGAALAIGGKVRYVPSEYNRINAGAYAWFAPDVLSFDKLEKYQEFGGYVGYNVTQSADVFIGYRNVKGKFKNFGNGTLDSGLHFGIRATF